MHCKLFAALATFTLAFAIIAPAPQACAAASASTSSSATSGTGPRREAFERFKAALEQLDLSPAQKEEIKSIVAAAREKLQALKGQTAEKGQRHEIIQSARKDIIAQLTQEQKKKLREILASEKSQAKS